MTDYEYMQAIIARGFDDYESCKQFLETTNTQSEPESEDCENEEFMGQ